MKFLFEKEKLTELLKDFYTLTKIRPVIFDSDFVKVAAYPEDDCEFCRKIRTNSNGRALCDKSDEVAFRKCSADSNFNIYRCHAGLVEAVSPLRMNDITIGYIMFGQIVEKNDKKNLKNKITDYIGNFTDNDFSEAERLFSSLVAKKSDQISAAAKIMESCACYLCVSELFKIDNGELIFHLDSYINNNLCADLSVNTLCRKFGINKNRLYEISQSLYGMGIASYIRKKRIKLAEKYLKQGYSVAEAAEKSGFEDYNYFSKIFKKENGQPPSKYK